MSYRRSTGMPRVPDRRSVRAADTRAADGVPAGAFEGRQRNLLACRRSRHLARGIRLRGIRLQIGELKLELVEQRATFRGLAEPLVPELPDRELIPPRQLASQLHSGHLPNRHGFRV
jgi:hypothetical protein